ncbi:MAG: hypothetical protein HYZ42_02285, partial [Bacteroidetes bacterium]|nr:hypothetical protein [Bacteroidota bacterium]
MQVEPRTILNFLASHFDALVFLFEKQNNEGSIPLRTFREFEEEFGHIEQQLFSYKILRKIGDDAEFSGEIYNLFQFVLKEFKPMLPETIEKYNTSIGSLYRLIREGINGDKLILSKRVDELYGEVFSFLESVEKNTIRLLAETRELKSNVTKIDYKQKVEKASFWIDYYIQPLNNILDISHAQSIVNKLLEISNFINVKRLNFHDETIRKQFEKLYFFMIQTNHDLLNQSRILTNELLPLIERIRTESLILTGWIEFLKAPNKVEVPKLLRVVRDSPYSDEMYYNAKDFVMQFQNVEDIIITEELVNSEMWIFNKEKYKENLLNQIPVNDFFDWAIKALKKEYKEVETEKLFSLTSLLFEDDFDKEFYISFFKESFNYGLQIESDYAYIISFET